MHFRIHNNNSKEEFALHGFLSPHSVSSHHEALFFVFVETLSSTCSRVAMQTRMQFKDIHKRSALVEYVACARCIMLTIFWQYPAPIKALPDPNQHSLYTIVRRICATWFLVTLKSESSKANLSLE